MTPPAPEEVSFKSGDLRLYGKLFAVARGEPAVLLLHGLGFHSFEYDALARLLAAAGLGCFAFDFRCHGRSEGPRGDWQLASLVDDARAAISFVSERTGTQVVVFGNSLGALVGVHLAAVDPRVASLVASGCPTRVADFAVTKFRFLLLRALKLANRIRPLRMSVNWVEPYRLILTDPGVIRRVRSDALVRDARCFFPSTYADIFSWSAIDAARAVRVPVLVLAARGDRLQPLSQSELLARSLSPRATVTVLDTASHVPNLETPEQMAPILIDWFSKTGLPAHATPPSAGAAQ